MYGDWFYTIDYNVFGYNVKATERSPPDNLTRWIITQSKGFTRKGIEKISWSVMVYVNLVLSSQVKARSTIVGNSAPAVDAQKVFKDTFDDLIKGDLSIDTKKYQGVLEQAITKVDFSVGVGICMLPNNLNYAIGRKEGCDNKILVSTTDMKIGSNRDNNNKKFSVAKPAARNDPLEVTKLGLKMLTEKHNDEKLAIILTIVGGGLVACLLV